MPFMAMASRKTRDSSAEGLAAADVPGRRRREPKQVKQAKTAPAVRREDEPEDNQFVSAVARALDVLNAFKPGDEPLGNAELAERTGLPKPTVSRLTYTLERCGYLSLDRRRLVYELGGRTVLLGAAALSSRGVRQIARPLLQSLANRANFTVGLGTRDAGSIIFTDAFEGGALVGLRLYPGYRVPVLTTAMGRAYLAGLEADDREPLLEELKPNFSDDWSILISGVQRALAEVDKFGYCTSVGEWRNDINSVAAPVRASSHGRAYSVGLSGPAYMLSERALREEWGPKVVEVARQIEAALYA